MDAQITSLESEQIQQLRAELADIEFPHERFGYGAEDFLIRWLREKKYKIKDATEAIRKYMQYRLDQDLDNIHNWVPSEGVDQQIGHEFCGFDTEGCPVYYVPWGSWDIKKMIDLGLGRDVLKVTDQLFELAERHVVAQSRVLDKQVAGYNFMVDLTGLSLRRFLSKSAIENIIDMVKSGDSYHSNTANIIYACNVPRAFTYIWKILKPFVKPELRKNILFHSNEASLNESFKKYNMPIECIPTVLGGNFHLKRFTPDKNSATEDGLEEEILDGSIY